MRNTMSGLNYYNHTVMVKISRIYEGMMKKELQEPIYGPHIRLLSGVINYQ